MRVELGDIDERYGTVEASADGDHLIYHGDADTMERLLRGRIAMARAEGVSMVALVASLPGNVRGWCYAKVVGDDEEEQNA